MPKWDHDIDEWIIKALTYKRLGRNEIYAYVDQRYRKVRHKSISLSKDVFNKHLRFLIQNDIVGKNDAGQRGTKIEHFLIEEADRKLQDGTLDIRALKNENEMLMEITPQTKQRALYILILMFNHTISLRFQKKNELESFLTLFHLKFYELSPRARLADEHESEGTQKAKRQFQTIYRSSDESVTVFMNEHISRYHGSTTIEYKCQIRGMTKQSVLSNRTDKPFQYLLLSPDQIDGVFDLLCKEQMLRPVSLFDGNCMYIFVDNDSYFLLLFLEDLFTEYVMPVMRKIWKNLRNPTVEERNWLILTEGEVRANRIITEDVEHRREIESVIRKKAGGIESVASKMLRDRKTKKTIEIEDQLKFVQDELNNYLKTYDYIINEHKYLQHIFDFVFPEFLRRLEL